MDTTKIQSNMEPHQLHHCMRLMIFWSSIFYIGIFYSVTYAEIQLPKGLIEYQPIEIPEYIQGKLTSQGSVRLVPIMTDWFKEFRHIYPNIKFKIKPGETGIAIDTLISGESTLAMMGRKINATELNHFIEAKNYRPVELRVAIDALRIIVNRHNPLTQLSQQQLDAIFSSTRKCGAPYSINTWEEFGWVPSAGDLTPIKPYIFPKKSGTHHFFRHKMLCNGKYRSKVNKHSKTSAEMIQAVSQSLTSIGFVSWDVIDYSVKSLALSKYRFHPHYLPTYKNVLTGKYPLSRYLYLYIDNPPQANIPLALQELFKFVFSHQGQQIVVKHQAIPLPIKHITEEIQRLSDFKN